MLRALFCEPSLLTALVLVAPASPTGDPRFLVPDSPEANVQTDLKGQRAVAPAGAAARRAPPAALQAAHWRTLGPYGGDIDDVRASPANPSIVLAGLAPSSGGAGGLFRSTDAGASWSDVAQLSGRSVHKIAFAPDGTAYAGTTDSIWKSLDGGATWSQLDLGIGLNDEVTEVTIEPSDPQHLWVGVADALGGQSVNVMTSTNGGTSWTNRTPPLASPQTCTGIAIHPSDPSRVYACFGGAFGGGQAWVSSTGGTSWTDRSAGLPNRPLKDVVHDGTRLLLCGGQLFGSQTVGLFSTANEGVNWTPLHDGSWPSLVIHSIALDPNHSNTILLGSAGKGVFQSTNGGVSWSFSIGGTGSLSVNAVSFSPGSSAVIYTGSSANAVWKSSNAGLSFSPSSTGIGRLDVYSVASNPRNPAELAIAFQGLNDGGVYSSLDGGLSWTPEAVPATRFNTVYFAPDGVLYAISGGPSSIAPEGLYRRTGATWAGIGPDQGTLFESELFGVEVSSHDASLIYATGNDFGVAGFEATIWRYDGVLWTKTYEGVAPSQSVRDLLIVSPDTDRTQIAAFADFSGSGSGGVLRSVDGASTWSPSSTGLPPAVQCMSLAAFPGSPGEFYVSNSGSAAHAVYRSVDRGQSWTGTGFMGSALAVAADFTDPGILYIATNTGPNRVMVSTDGGIQFGPYDSGLAGAGFARDMVRTPGLGRELLLATQSGSYATAIAPFVPYCFGDGTTATTCPCGNSGGPQRGCANSVNPVGALLDASGATNPDTVSLTASGVPPGSLCLFVQGDGRLFDGAVYGDGILCVGGSLKRLGSGSASGDTASYPAPGDPSISVRSAALGDPFGPGALRYYQTYYRNPDPAFCPTPPGGTFNASNALQINW